jgi:hypothetical protein
VTDTRRPGLKLRVIEWVVITGWCFECAGDPGQRWVPGVTPRSQERQRSVTVSTAASAPAAECQTTRGHDMRRSARSARHKQPYSLPEVTSGFRFGFPFGAPGTGLGARARGCPQAAAVRLITCSSPRSEARPGGWS